MDGWLPTPPTYKTTRKYEYEYSWVKPGWWQFIKKRRWNKAMKQFTPGTRIRLKNPGTFTDKYTIVTWKEIKPKQ